VAPGITYAHHVGNAEDMMPEDQWEFVDGVAHGEGDMADPMSHAREVTWRGEGASSTEDDVSILGGDQVQHANPEYRDQVDPPRPAGDPTGVDKPTPPGVPDDSGDARGRSGDSSGEPWNGNDDPDQTKLMRSRES
jgi:hypothetical protein